MESFERLRELDGTLRRWDTALINRTMRESRHIKGPRRRMQDSKEPTSRHNNQHESTKICSASQPSPLPTNARVMPESCLTCAELQATAESSPPATSDMEDEEESDVDAVTEDLTTDIEWAASHKLL
jgi:hypothetical protein